MGVVGPVVLAPATVLVVGVGVWMVLDSTAWGFDQTWVKLAIGLFAGAFLIGFAFQSRAALKADRAASAGDALTPGSGREVEARMAAFDEVG